MILNKREHQLQELENFTKSITKEISEITSTLGWTVESLTKNNEIMVTCPYNSAHEISEKFFKKHWAACKWKAEGYAPTDIPLPESSLSLHSTSSIVFDKQLLENVIQTAKEKDSNMKLEIMNVILRTTSICMGERLIPQTSNRIFADFTSDERKTIYEYVIANTIAPDIGSDIKDLNKPKSDTVDKKTTYLELLAQERNLKRRRAKHKGVHTNKKSQTEILREVINQQMEIYAEYLQEQEQPVLPNITENPSRQDKYNKIEDPSDSYFKYSKSDNLFLKEHNGQQHYYENYNYSKHDKYYNDSYFKSKEESRKRRSSSVDTSKYKRSKHKHKSRSKERHYHHRHHHESMKERKSEEYSSKKHRHDDHHSLKEYRHKDHHKSKKHKSKGRSRSPTGSSHSKHKRKDRSRSRER